MCNFRMRNDVEAGSASASRVRQSFGSSSTFVDQQIPAPSLELPLAPVLLELEEKIKSDSPENMELPHIDVGALPAIPENASLIEPATKKRPVGRPRIHPKKIIDPNRVKRGWYLTYNL